MITIGYYFYELFPNIFLRHIVVAASNVVNHLFIIIVFPIRIHLFFDIIDVVGVNSSPYLLLRGSLLQHHPDFATVDCVELEMRMPTVN
jgi:hypothetical protein